MIVADTGAVIALIDRDNTHHPALRQVYDARPDDWLLPWAILPEVDHILRTRYGLVASRTFLTDLADGLWTIEWSASGDLARAREIEDRYRDLEMGLVDACVMALAERVRARAIATLDVRDFAAVELEGSPQLWPRDL